MRARTFATWALALITICGCGKYGPPVPPEYLAPSAVVDLSIQGSEQGVKFAWKSPQRDLRNHELKYLDGYRLYRSTLENPRELLQASRRFELLSTIQDTHLVALEEARAALRAEGKPSHRARPDAAKTHFEFLDSSVKEGSKYLYKLVPFNQSNVEGSAFSIFEVTWSKANSSVREVSRADLMAEQELDS